MYIVLEDRSANCLDCEQKVIYCENYSLARAVAGEMAEESGGSALLVYVRPTDRVESDCLNMPPEDSWYMDSLPDQDLVDQLIPGYESYVGLKNPDWLQ